MRPDVVPPSLAEALSTLQDDMTPFDDEMARQIVWREFTDGEKGGSKRTMVELEALMSHLTEPVAAASIGQVYKAFLPGRGEVAVKVKRPGVRQLVEVCRLLCCHVMVRWNIFEFTTTTFFNTSRLQQRDTELLLTVAKFIESLPALPSSNTANTESKQTRLINTQLVSATREFMSRIFEALDYRNEARNLLEFAHLYSKDGGNSSDVSVVVPRVYMDWCTENVLGKYPNLNLPQCVNAFVLTVLFVHVQSWSGSMEPNLLMYRQQPIQKQIHKKEVIRSKRIWPWSK